MSVKFFFFFLCLNLSIFVVNNGDFAPMPDMVTTPIDVNSTITNWNTTSFRGEPTVQTFFDIGSTLILLGKLIITMVAGSGFLLMEFGAPMIIWVPLFIINLAVNAFMFIELRGGTALTDE